MMLPEEIIAIPLSLVLGGLPSSLNLMGTSGVILPVGAWGFSILVMTEFMKDVPIELEEAARIDGVGRAADRSGQIILPLCKPALGVIGVFGFMMIWDQYLLPLIAANDPVRLHAHRCAERPAQDPEVGSGGGAGGRATRAAAQPDRLSCSSSGRSSAVSPPARRRADPP